MENQNPDIAQPLISIVMCAYNAGPFLKPAIDSILNQTYTNWELIVSDDGSNDGTRERLRELEGHPKIRLFFQEKNLSYVANKNFGHHQAKGEYITQLDNDDVYAPDKLEKQMAAIRQNPSLKMVACGYHRISEDGSVFDTTTPPADQMFTGYDGHYPFWFPSLLVHKSVFEKVGYFDTYFSGVYGDDRYWTVKANEHFPIWCLKEPLYSYRSNHGAMTSVMNNERKLIIITVVEELLRQQRATGTDWLEQKDFASLKSYEESLLNDKQFIGNEYRVWAAMAIDKKNWGTAAQLLRKAFARAPFSSSLYRTMYYYIRQRFL